MSSTPIALQTEKIQARVEDGIGWLAFNNPERRNAISLEMWQGLGDAAEAFEADPAVRVVVMRGAGGKSFAAGADISEFAKYRANAEQKASYGKISKRGSDGLWNLSKPLIALIQGSCIGGGLAIALAADVRFATPVSRFGIPAAKLGLGYDYPGLAALARLVGPSTAKDIMFTARYLPADEARAVGLINFIYADGQIEDEVRQYAQLIASNAPLTVAAAKAAVKVFERYSLDPESEQLSARIDRCFNSEDYQEGRTAFMEKRPPKFKGR
jgi:enoyl-CoA hydratase/carnithine racemase